MIFSNPACLSAGARAGVRQRVGRGRGRPKAASVLKARWRLGSVTTFIDISRLQRLCCMFLIIICFLSMLAYRPTTRCHKSQFDCRAGGLGGSNRADVTTAAGKVAVNWIQLCYI